MKYWLSIFLSYILIEIKSINNSGVVTKEGGGFEVLDWNEYERGSRDFNFVLNVHGRTKECFCEHLLDESKIFLSFEVLTGSTRVLDYYFTHEKGTFCAKYGFTFDTLEVAINETSEWKFCFVNIYNEDKQLYVYGSFYHPYSIGPTKEERNQTIKAKITISEQSRKMMSSLENIEQQSLKLQQLTSQTQSHEFVDSIAQESNKLFILKWAIFQLFVIIGVGICQVYVVRHWFFIQEHNHVSRNKVPF